MTKQRKQYYRRQASQMSTICKLLKVCVGTVVLAFPEGFKKVYLTGGILVLFICGLLQYYSWTLLIRVIEEKAEIKKKEEQEKQQAQAQNNSQVMEIEMVTQTLPQVSSQRSLSQNGKQEEEFEEIIGDDIIDDIEDEDNKKIRQEEEEYRKQANNPLAKKAIKFEKMNMMGVMLVIDPTSRVLVIISKIMTILLFYGQALSLLIFCKQTFDQIIPNFADNPLNTLYLAICTIAFIMAFSFITRMETLKQTTNIGSYLVFIVMYFFTCVCLYQIKNSGSSENNPTIRYGIKFSELPFFFGVTLYSYDINGILTEIREEMKHPEKFRKNLASSMLICCIIYTSFGVCGYLAFGDSTQELITSNLLNVVSDIGLGIQNAFYALQMTYVLSMIQTILLQNVVCIRLMEELPFDFQKSDVKPILSIWSKFAIRILYISGCVFGGYYLTNFSTIISLLGCIPSVYLGFVMPYYLYKKVFGRQKMYLEIINGTVLFFGVAGAILGIIQIFGALY
ncbi:unnamed protein product (macronuclear) [Paramecium tetraurelia]|uniref:Amino acid transporter transmembrane domain-containing protein n=1 Tax=Paramecium tetraurelia TaxID=5888 RepID=A0EB07_PARTE|nr:uncharacterized protein GSPATT00025208001 [Paramecium tetraurelia]CAK92474.1 unnamed protein product [Paramecium tetraurelia]|eukprot:XP_001459871.1 hypothetical protein (macronuclear) [Paramecium tetraurelia strain d4-2]